MRIVLPKWWLFILMPVAAAAAGACVGDSSPPIDAGNDATTDALAPDAATDGGIDAADAAPPCNLNGTFAQPTTVAGLSGLASPARFSSDELTAYFALAVGDAGTLQLYVATRPTLNDPFGARTAITPLNDALGESTPWVAPNGLTIFYGHDEGNGATLHDIWYATRPDTVGSFQNPGPVGNVNDPNYEDDYPSQASNGDLWFSSRRNVDSGLNEIYTAVYGVNGFGSAARQAGLTSPPDSSLYPVLTPDLLRIFFQHGMSATIWTATRANAADPFGTPQPVSELNVDGMIEKPAWVSPDGCRLYVSQGDPATMLVASRPAN